MPAMKIHLNGQLIDGEAATLSVEDAGFQHAVGLFETMAAFNGVVFRIEDHLDRLLASAEVLGLTRQLDRGALATAVHEAVAGNELVDARVRLTVTAGEVSMLKPVGSDPPRPTVLAIATPPTQYDPKYFEQGVLVTIAGPMANPFDPMAGHKTLNYWPRLRALRQSATAGAGETIVLNVTNHLAGGAISNAFLVKDNALLTPIARGEEGDGALPAPVLPGITRAAVIEIAERVGLEVQRKMLSVDDLLPVTKIEQASVGDGEVGKHTKALREALLKLVASACGLG